MGGDAGVYPLVLSGTVGGAGVGTVAGGTGQEAFAAEGAGCVDVGTVGVLWDPRVAVEYRGAEPRLAGRVGAFAVAAAGALGAGVAAAAAKGATSLMAPLPLESRK